MASPDRPASIDELKDVVNLACHEFFERRQYLPPDPLQRDS
jgi:hypothetical protein